MKITQHIFPKKSDNSFIVFILMLFSFAILYVRISITKTMDFLFLVWNVFLAIIPFIITMYLSQKKHLSKLSVCFAFVVWLLFLPNAPYIITDLFHIKTSSYQNIWIDTLVISTFAISGMLLFYFSLFEMKRILLRFLNKTITEAIIIGTITLSAFGVYIGRFLRYNSWEILSNPQQLFNDMFSMVLHPVDNKNVWLFTSAFSLFLVIGYYIKTCFKLKEH